MSTNFLTTPTDNALFNAFIALASVFKRKPKPKPKIELSSIIGIGILAGGSYLLYKDFLNREQGLQVPPPPVKPAPKPRKKRSPSQLRVKNGKVLVSYFGQTVKQDGKVIFQRGATYRAEIKDGVASIENKGRVTIIDNPAHYKVTRILN